MATSASLNLRALLKTAISRSGMDAAGGRRVGSHTRRQGAVRRRRRSGAAARRVFYVVPTDADLEEAVADVCFFLAALEGLSAAAADRAVLPFPSHEIDPYRGMSPHFGVIVRARAGAARARLRHGAGRRGVGRGAGASRQRSRTAAWRAAIDLKPGQDIAPTDLAELLVDAGFAREDPADEHGEFAVRGGIVDIVAAGDAPPVRLEFIGDTIETLRTYDPATQRSIAPIDQLAIVPLRDVLPSARRD